MSPDLEFATLDDIHAELRKRYAAFVLITIGDGKAGDERISTRYGGGMVTSLGLAKIACTDLTRQLSDDREWQRLDTVDSDADEDGDDT